MDNFDAAAATRLDDRAVVRMAGDDVRGFLQGLVTNDVMAVAPDRPVWAGLLSPQGKALFDFILWDGGDGAILIDCEAAEAPALTQRLTLYRLRRAITLTPAPTGVHWSREPIPGAAADPRLAALGYRWLGPAAGDSASDEWRRHRLALGVAEGAGELGRGETLWLEANARELNGVSFAKGCYVGQENTARMHHRAKVNRRLVVAPIAAEGPRTRCRYPDLGLMIELRRVDDLGDAHIPAWLAAALATDRAEEQAMGNPAPAA
ncbi:folate-binding protein [Sphingomonas sp. SFZ2018-12]|uniref:CAF17-like 4Fe-4S cluster assembly/insertion protein YgfZ n=1 Tax=Sphingomonas sp. SFZ2018-12 TaxID=2683197 RepID=UPI001F10B423|nr:folate-binding protein [Sphingomonas sp. SFZ2018-12]MCH4893473.1 folate-binding protein [Sphingomonas sp. SFZ2018-12]